MRSPIAVVWPGRPGCRLSVAFRPITSTSIWPVSATRRVRLCVARLETPASTLALETSTYAIGRHLQNSAAAWYSP
ncbi:hypothetical protein C1J01_25355 [Nonomuraea aridisoli]|uniref:Uncharacterized protein n=1 Tax=Nonomuraea aridisoli TaxID=2070368 RepID=A0A2W2DSP4_9ACTN|nr:hypothetical protein C1J01_25355 [Nonomuraea aridisoli]